MKRGKRKSAGKDWKSKVYTHKKKNSFCECVLGIVQPSSLTATTFSSCYPLFYVPNSPRAPLPKKPTGLCLPKDLCSQAILSCWDCPKMPIPKRISSRFPFSMRFGLSFLGSQNSCPKPYSTALLCCWWSLCLTSTISGTSTKTDWISCLLYPNCLHFCNVVSVLFLHVTVIVFSTCDRILWNIYIYIYIHYHQIAVIQGSLECPILPAPISIPSVLTSPNRTGWFSHCMRFVLGFRKHAEPNR